MNRRQARRIARHKEDPSVRTKRNRIKRIKFRTYIRNLKLECGCKVCGYNKCAAALDFHHVRGEKLFNVGVGSNWSRSTEKVKVGIKKCDIICANCHRELTYA